MRYEEMSREEKNALIHEHIIGFGEPVKVRPHGVKDTWKVAFKRKPEGSNAFGEYSCWYTEDGTKIYCGKPFDIHFPPNYLSWEGIGRIATVMIARPEKWNFRLDFDHDYEGRCGWEGGFYGNGLDGEDAPKAFEAEPWDAVAHAALRAVGAVE